MAKDGPGPGTGKLLAIIAGALVVLSALFGLSIVRGNRTFVQHRDKLYSEAPWERAQMSVDACLDMVLSWSHECPGQRVWCDGEIGNVLDACLSSVDRTDYCAEQGNETMSTRFGYDECARRYDAIEEKYARRAEKKACAAAMRAIAAHCGGVMGERKSRSVGGIE